MKFSPPGFFTGFTCIVCGTSYPYANAFTCPSCGIEGILDVQYDYARISKQFTRDALRGRGLDHWRYRELLPVSPDLNPPHLQVGWTPIYDVPRLAKSIGVRKLFVKD